MVNIHVLYLEDLESEAGYSGSFRLISEWKYSKIGHTWFLPRLYKNLVLRCTAYEVFESGVQ
jgi:hypothetical protein